MKVKVFDTKGKNTKEVELSKDVWEVKMNEDLVSQAVLVYQSNQRKGSANTKTRAEVRGGGKKPWKQKGTGRARHGSIRSPLWTKGGVTFGPKPYKKVKSLSKKMANLAMRCVLSQIASESNVILLDGLKSADMNKTKNVENLMKTFEILDKKVLLIAENEDKDVALFGRGVSNLKTIDLKMSNQVNIFDVINSDKVVFINGAVKDLESRLI